MQSKSKMGTSNQGSKEMNRLFLGCSKWSEEEEDSETQDVAKGRNK